MPSKFDWYPADDEKLSRRSKTHKQTKLKTGLQPGHVLIILSGRFKGKRVVFLKQLESGLLLVTGPFCINGVPLRRVNQAYTIGTSTQLDVSGVDVKAVDDKFFAKEAATKSTKEQTFLAGEPYKKNPVSDNRKDLQKKVDKAITGAIKDKLVSKYLQARFTLTNGQHPHSLKF